jgi:hypothetical protein
VAHVYAGILGYLAFLTSLARGVMHGGGTASVLWTAWLSLLAFAAVGYAIGWVAGTTVDESVRGRISAELAGRSSAGASSPPTDGEPRAGPQPAG